MKMVVFDTRVQLSVSDDFNLLDYASQLHEHVQLVDDIQIHRQNIIGIQMVHEEALVEKKTGSMDERSPFSKH